MESLVMEISKSIHRSVMTDEVISYLITRPEGIYVDATLGMGGHTKSILEHTGPGSLVIGLDVDGEAISIVCKTLSEYNDRVLYINSNFSDIDRVLDSLDIREVDGIIADLGMSSYQIESSGRGFSFLREESLDMRMDPRLRLTAHDLVNEMTMEEISRVLKMYGEERWSRRIAKKIVESRKDSPIETSAELARIVSLAIPKKFHPVRIHPATKTFQALRIAVNNELENIRELMEKAVYRLKVGGRLVIISFHSLEDRLIKTHFQKLSSPCVCPPGMPVCGCGKKRVLKVLTRSPIIPGGEEISSNLRARSAKLRVGERV
jgi:16S rRNA (cytosine1402-N4)-methyltransferase